MSYQKPQEYADMVATKEVRDRFRTLFQDDDHLGVFTYIALFSPEEIERKIERKKLCSKFELPDFKMARILSDLCDVDLLKYKFDGERHLYWLTPIGPTYIAGPHACQGMTISDVEDEVKEMGRLLGYQGIVPPLMEKLVKLKLRLKDIFK